MKALDTILIIIFVLCGALMLMANEDPFVRDEVCAQMNICPVGSHAAAWNKMLYDLAVGSIITLFFYALVVRLPDHQKRKRLKRSLNRHYRNFKKDCIHVMVAVIADGSYDASLPDTLIEQDKFRAYFKEEIRGQHMDRFDRFQNDLNEYYLREMLTYMEIFRDELVFILNNTDIENDKVFEYIKQLSALIYTMRNVTLGYDESKPLARFLWDMFAGFDMANGYRKEDFVQKMIDAI